MCMLHVVQLTVIRPIHFAAIAAATSGTSSGLTVVMSPRVGGTPWISRWMVGRLAVSVAWNG